MLKQLVKVANRLDSLGLTKEADTLDREIVRLASDGDFDLSDFKSGESKEEEEEDQSEIIKRYSPTSSSEPEVVRIKTSPSSTSHYEPSASASPRPLQEIPSQEVETSVPSLPDPKKPSRLPAKDLRESFPAPKKTFEPPAKQLTEEEKDTKDRITKLIADAKSGNREALKNVLLELEMIGSPALKKDSPEGIIPNERGWKLDTKVLEELKGLLEAATEIKESDSEEQANKKRRIRTRLLKALGVAGRSYELEKQFAEGKFYLVKRLKGKRAPWSYVAEYADLESAEIAEGNLEEEDSEHEYAVYEGSTAKNMLDKKSLSPTPSHMDPYFGMTQAEVVEERRRRSEEERNERIKFMEQNWQDEMERLLQKDPEFKAWQIPKMPDFAGVVPRVDMPDESKVVRDRAWESQNIEETDSEEDKPKKSNDDLSPEWMQQQEARLQEAQKERIRQLNMKERLRREDEEIRERLKKVKEGKPLK